MENKNKNKNKSTLNVITDNILDQKNKIKKLLKVITDNVIIPQPLSYESTYLYLTTKPQLFAYLHRIEEHKPYLC
jgi:hypothetical protein